MNSNHQSQDKPYSSREQGYKCDGCSRSVLAGEEELRFITNYVEVKKLLFCRICGICRGGDEISKQPFRDPVFDPEKIKKVTEALGYKKYREDKQFSENTKELNKELEGDWQEYLKKGYNFGFNNPQAIRVRNPNIEKNEAMLKLKEIQDKEELAKELERVRGGLPKTTEKG